MDAGDGGDAAACSAHPVGVHARTPREQPRYDKTLATLRDAVTKHAGDPDNPWAIGHGLLAMGPDFVLSNSQPAVDWIFSQYAEELPLGDAAGDYRAVVFPRSRGEQRIEPHAGLMLKALTEIGVAPDKAVTVQGQPHTVADLYRGVLMSSYLVPERTTRPSSRPTTCRGPCRASRRGRRRTPRCCGGRRTGPTWPSPT